LLGGARREKKSPSIASIVTCPDFIGSSFAQLQIPSRSLRHFVGLEDRAEPQRDQEINPERRKIGLNASNAFRTRKEIPAACA
jgi:hypothetical protein